MKYLEGMIPLIKRLRDKASVEDEELRRVLGDEAPRLVVEGARRSIGTRRTGLTIYRGTAMR
jgi:hypothetical protein